MRSYPSNLSDFQWSLLSALFPSSGLGRPPIHAKRRILDAIFYVLKSGCHWAMLPLDFPPFKTVYDYFSRWRADGTWAQVNAQLNRITRKHLQRKVSPSLLITDSQSVKGSQGKQVGKGYDGHKKVNGRKRHLLVDALGLVFACYVTAANVHDSRACEQVLEEAFRNSALERAETLLADLAYRGVLEDLVPLRFGLRLSLTKNDPDEDGRKPKRWIVERTNAWMSVQRRIGRDYEVKTESSIAWTYVANIRLALGKIQNAA